jgi:hypothetical protein
MEIVGAKIDRDVHFDEFLKVLKREGTPRYLSFYEHFATNAFMEARLPAMKDARGTPRYWELYAEFYLSLGYDCIPLEMPLLYGKIKRKETSYRSEEGTCIESMEDFEKLAWPDEEAPIDFEPLGELTPLPLWVCSKKSGINLHWPGACIAFLVI